MRAEERRTAREERKRKRNKERAGKQFERQYAFDEGAAGTEEGAPRAALYEGKMGSRQRKSARMQAADSASPAMAKLNPAGWFSNFNLSSRALRIGTAVLCVVLAFVFLYTPAKQYYQSVREHDKLEAEYAAIQARNEALDEQVDALASDAGMEDAVRQKYGYVVTGDQTAVVTGLSDDASSFNGNDNIEANVLSSTVKAPEEWYTPILDAFFGVE
ncbi:MAG: septum formation initiator family protein [Eggerthellaceae bacterium]|nr:septum formation initiator family protein [Eggerthellaceae bacterium]